MGSRVWGILNVWRVRLGGGGLGFRVRGLGMRASSRAEVFKGLGLKIECQGPEFRVWGVGFRIQG